MRSVLAGLLLFACLLTGACSGDVEEASAETEAARLELPEQLVGLRLQPEKVSSDLEEVVRPYVDSVSVFSFREDDLLRASFQVNRFNRAARADDASFRRSIVGTIGGTAPIELHVEDIEVYATSASDQTVYTWFSGDGMFVLAVQADFEFPRTLLRRILELDLEL